LSIIKQRQTTKGLHINITKTDTQQRNKKNQQIKVVSYYGGKT